MASTTNRAEKDRLEDLYWTNQFHVYLENEVPFNVDMRRHLAMMHRRLRLLPSITTLRIHDITNIVHLEVELRDQIVFMLEGSRRALGRMGSGRALELGCGPGWLVLECARLGLDTEGVDLSAGNIRIARWFGDHQGENPEQLLDPFLGFTLAAPERQGRLRFEVADLRELEREARSYDLLLSWQSLHHVAELDAVLQKVSGWLKPEGELIICDHLENTHHYDYQAVAEMFLAASKELDPWYELVMTAATEAGRPAPRDLLERFAERCRAAVRTHANEHALAWAGNNLRAALLDRILNACQALPFADPCTSPALAEAPLSDQNVRFLRTLGHAERLLPEAPALPPYEDVSQHEILDGVRRHFDIFSLEERCGFTGTALVHAFYERFLRRHLDTGLPHMIYLARLLKLVDDLLIQEKLVPGIHPLIAARPRSAC